MLRGHIRLSLISDFVIFKCNFFAYFKFHSDLGRVIGKIKQNELDCRDTAPLGQKSFISPPCLRQEALSDDLDSFRFPH